MLALALALALIEFIVSVGRFEGYMKVKKVKKVKKV